MNFETPFDTNDRYGSPGGVNDQVRDEYGIRNSSTQTDFNALAHALTSAAISFIHGDFISAVAGHARELNNKPGANSLADTRRDVFNNNVGREIAKYAKDSDLEEAALIDLVVDALNRGLLIVDELNDPRMSVLHTRNPYGLPDAKYDGPSPEVAYGLERSLGLPAGSLNTGSLSGPGTPLDPFFPPSHSPRPLPRSENFNRRGDLLPDTTMSKASFEHQPEISLSISKSFSTLGNEVGGGDFGEILGYGEASQAGTLGPNSPNIGDATAPSSKTPGSSDSSITSRGVGSGCIDFCCAT